MNTKKKKEFHKRKKLNVVHSSIYRRIVKEVVPYWLSRCTQRSSSKAISNGVAMREWDGAHCPREKMCSTFCFYNQLEKEIFPQVQCALIGDYYHTLQHLNIIPKVGGPRDLNPWFLSYVVYHLIHLLGLQTLYYNCHRLYNIKNKMEIYVVHGGHEALMEQVRKTCLVLLPHEIAIEEQI